MNPEVFRQTLAEHGIQLSNHQMQQFADYYELLVKTNEQFNLTTITEQSEVYLKHFYDSLTPALYAPELRTHALELCDVGAGAGFPSIPLKIAFPQLKITIVDSLNKRINFLNDLATRLQLTEVHFFHDRAELFGSKKSAHRESYDVVTARAVARLSVLSEFCLPLVKVGGQMIALKAANANEEQSDARKAVQMLGGQLVGDDEFQLPISGDDRHLIIIDKVQSTPKRYPRKPGTPAKQPLSGE